MVIIERYSPESREEWNSFLQQTAAKHFMFNRSYIEYHSDRFEDHSLLFRDERGSLCAIFPANLKGENLQSHGGLTFGGVQAALDTPQGIWMEILSALVTYCKEQNFRSIDYRPVPLHFHGSPSQGELYALTRLGATLKRRTFYSVVDLTQPLRFQSRRQRGAKKAVSSGALVSGDNTLERWQEYWELLTGVLRERFDSQPVHSFNEIWSLRECFPDAIQLQSVILDEQIIAGVILFRTPMVLKTQYISAGAKGREIGALDLLFQTLITNQLGEMPFFDFGSSASEEGFGFNPGLVEQKEGFGGLSVVQDFYHLEPSLA